MHCADACIPVYHQLPDVFLAIFFVVIYEDIRPIIMQTVICAAAMAVFYVRYADRLAETWTADAMAA